MQSFLPYSSFELSAKCLDNKRLGKQRIEAWQIYLALTKPDYGWKNHPIVKMWKGYEEALIDYGIAICEEWINRGFKDSMLERFALVKKDWTKLSKLPPWIGLEEFHASHRSNLLRKNKEHYSQFNWKEPNNYPYYWMINSPLPA